MALPAGRLTVEIHNADNVHNIRTFGQMNPYVSIEVGGEKYKTHVHRHGHTAPVFNNYSMIFNLNGSADKAHIKLNDEELLGHACIGRADVRIVDLCSRDGPRALVLVDSSNFTKQHGVLHVTTHFQPNGGASPATSTSYVPSSPPPPYTQHPQSALSPPSAAAQQTLYQPPVRQEGTSGAYPYNPQYQQTAAPPQQFPTSSALSYAPPPMQYPQSQAVSFPASVKDPRHPHPLHLRPYVYSGQYGCNVCGRDGSGAAYHCEIDGFDAHPTCMNLAAPTIQPQYQTVDTMQSISQRTDYRHAHPLTHLNSIYNGEYKCDGCGQPGYGDVFHCQQGCGFDLHPQCVR